MRGLIDFSKAEVRNLDWWRKVSAILNALELEDIADISKMYFNFTLARLGIQDLDQQAKRDTLKLAIEQAQDYSKLLQPWVNTKKTNQDFYKNAINAYKKTFGIKRLDDPEFNKYIDKVLAEDRKVRMETQVDSSDLLQEAIRKRDEAYRKVRGW